MLRKFLPLALMLGSIGSAQALSAGDLAFTTFNADEDGWTMVSFTDIAANTTVYFGDNEWNGGAIGSGGAFNTGESYFQWNSGSSVIAAGSVIRFSAIDTTSLASSKGSLSRATVSGSTNYGLANSNETLYAYVGSLASAPTAFITAITNSDFGSTDGTLAGTGLIAGVNAQRLNLNTPSASPDFGEYTGARSGLASYADYKALVANVSNWTVDTTNGTYTTTLPNVTNFTVTAVPEPASAAMLFAGLGLLAAMVRRRTVR